jgi:hypothetical protein
MRYELYTTVDITNTGQYRTEPGKEAERWKEQNFQTVLLTLGIRTNITYMDKPQVVNVKGSILGFETSKIIKVWTFAFDTERNYPFGTTENPIEFLTSDFEGVPFISGLDESMKQNYDVFVTEGTARNIIFHQK